MNPLSASFLSFSLSCLPLPFFDDNHLGGISGVWLHGVLEDDASISLLDGWIGGRGKNKTFAGVFLVDIACVEIADDARL